MTLQLLTNGSALIYTIPGKPHPRSFGTSPRVLGKYTRDEKVLTLPDAIRKMTSLPAQVLGLRDRGLLRKGYWADIVVFDPDRVADTATYDNPKQYPKGIDYVLVNGAVVIDNGNHTGARPGKVVYGPENEAHENVRPVFQLKSQIADKLADSRNKPRFGRVHGSLNS